MKVKEESAKAGLKPNIQKMKIITSGPNTSWQMHGGKMEIVTDFVFLWSKITPYMTAAMKLKDTCSFEGKLTNLDSVLKSRDITLLTNII